MKGFKQSLRVRNVREAARKTNRQHEHWKLLHDTALVMMRELSLEQLLETLIRKAMTLGSENGYIYLLDNPDSTSMHLKVNIGNVERLATYQKGTDEGIVGRVWETGQIQVVFDYQRWPHRITDPVFDDVQTALGIPLKVDGRITGVFGLHYNENHPVGSAEIDMLKGFAELASIALGNARLHSSLHKAYEELAAANEELIATEEELRAQYDQVIQMNEKVLRHNAVLSTLHETALGLMNRLDINEVLQTIVERAAELAATDSAFIMLLNKEEGCFERKIAIGLFKHDIGGKVEVDQGLVGEAYRLGRTVVVPDYSKWEKRVPNPLFDAIHANMHIPLMAGSEVVGTLGLATTNPEKQFGAEMISLMQQFAQLASIALVNAQLHSSLIESEKQLQKNNEDITAAHEELLASEEELKQQLEEIFSREEEIRRQNIVLTTLHEITLALMLRQNLNDVLTMIISSAAKLIGTQHGYVSLMDEEKGSFERKVGLGYYANDIGRLISVRAGGMVRQVYHTGEIVLVDDYCNWEKRLKDPFFDSLRSVIHVPLKVGGKVVGAFGLAFLDSSQKFTSQQIALLARFAEMASIALDNAMLLNSYRREIEERKQAEKLQKALYLISETVSSSDNLEELYRSVHAIVGELIPAKNFLIAIHEAATGMLYFPYRMDEQDGNPGSRKFAKGMPEYVIRTGKPVLIDPELRAKLEAEGEVKTVGTAGLDWLGVPLKTAGNKVFGVMAVQTFTERVRYSEEDQAILTFVSNQVAMAIERKQAEETSKYLGLHDTLTGLYNRAYFTEEMRRLQGERYLPNTVVMCDLDGLKLINDTFGHAAGDQLLIATAGIIRKAIRQGDVAARIGGDEFAILLSTADEKVAASLAERLRTQTEKYNRKTSGVPLSVSFGYAVRHNHEVSLTDLLKEADNNMYREKLHHSRSVRSTIVQTVMKLLEERDFATEEHADRMQELASKLVQKLGLPERRVAEIRLLTKFHDVGKIGIPDHILLKEGPLTTQEWAVMKRHCEIGYRIAQSSPDLVPISDWILKHHEWWNGEGYPFGLSGDEIPLECRILAIVDAYDAMTSDRPYRRAMSHEAAVDELKRCSGQQFDPDLVKKFFAVL